MMLLAVSCWLLLQLLLVLLLLLLQLLLLLLREKRVRNAEPSSNRLSVFERRGGEGRACLPQFANCPLI